MNVQAQPPARQNVLHVLSLTCVDGSPSQLHSAFDSCLCEARLRGSARGCGSIVLIEKGERFLASPPWVAAEGDDGDGDFSSKV
jgi:hypothetical protein